MSFDSLQSHHFKFKANSNIKFPYSEIQIIVRSVLSWYIVRYCRLYPTSFCLRSLLYRIPPLFDSSLHPSENESIGLKRTKDADKRSCIYILNIHPYIRIHTYRRAVYIFNETKRNDITNARRDETRWRTRKVAQENDAVWRGCSESQAASGYGRGFLLRGALHRTTMRCDAVRCDAIVTDFAGFNHAVTSRRRVSEL